MRGFLIKAIERQVRRLTMEMALGLAIVGTAAVAMSGPDEPKFDQAELAVAKAQVLLGRSLCETTDQPKTEFCDQLVQRAEELLARAREAMAAAATIADGGDVELPRR